MEISRELLNNLYVPDYDRLKSLRRKEKFFRVTFCGTLTVLSFALYFYLLFLFYNLFGRDKSCWLMIGFYSFCLLIGAVLEYYPAFFDFLVRNRQAHLEIKDLQAEFAEVERQVAEPVRKYVQGEAASIIRQMRWGISNRRNCEHLGAALLENDALAREASEVLSDSRLKRQYLRVLRKEEVSIKDGVIRMSPPERYVDEPPARQESGWRKKRQSTNEPISLNIKTGNESHSRQSETVKFSEAKVIEPEVEQKSSTSEIFSGTEDRVSRQHQSFEEPENSSVPKRATTRRRASKTASEPTTEGRNEPPKTKSPRPGRVFQPSADYYRKVADRKMEIGKRGELFVMEHEKQRIIKEEGADFLNRLEHSSVIKGDGLGYDILSYENGAEIYIEVKTTIGRYSANIFFTENEFRAMREYKGRYCLYRVYEFDEATNIGQLLIFKGKEMIESNFDFSPRVYVLTQKKE